MGGTVTGVVNYAEALRGVEVLSLVHFAKVAVANKRERMSERSEYGQNLSNVKPRSGRNTPKRTEF